VTRPRRRCRWRTGMGRGRRHWQARARHGRAASTAPAPPGRVRKQRPLPRLVRTWKPGIAIGRALKVTAAGGGARAGHFQSSSTTGTARQGRGQPRRGSRAPQGPSESPRVVPRQSAAARMAEVARREVKPPSASRLASISPPFTRGQTRDCPCLCNHVASVASFLVLNGSQNQTTEVVP
jgi:hypothetical protein